MKKIGIITFYYKSGNYGGILQSYALEKCVQNNGYGNVEQICIKCIPTKKIKKLFNLKKLVIYIIRKFNYNKYKLNYEKSIDCKSKSFRKMAEDIISHSEKVYCVNDMHETLVDYDVFIVGSDQVWNVDNYNLAYRLDFVPASKYKFSYAAGVSSAELTAEQKKIFKNTLSSYDAVSVREEKSVSVLSPLTDKKVEWVVDPTLLLNQEQWDEVCSPREISEKYIFCYFLGGLNIKNSDIIKFAANKGLKIVTFPFLCCTSTSDGDFGDYRIYDASPQDFISYIKYAEYVFTDSFHASVFSHIYKRNFFVFNRKGFKAMNDRIYSLTDLFDTQDRFCDTKEKCSLQYIEALPSINYNREFPKFETMKDKSIKFLKNNLKKAEEKLNGTDGI